MLDDVAKKYISYTMNLRGIKVAQVTTAVPLTAELEEKVLAKVKELTGSDENLKILLMNLYWRIYSTSWRHTIQC